MIGIEIVRRLSRDSWVIDRIHGSHYVMKKNGKTEVIPVHNRDLPTGLLKAVYKRTGLNE